MGRAVKEEASIARSTSIITWKTHMFTLASLRYLYLCTVDRQVNILYKIKMRTSYIVFNYPILCACLRLERYSPVH